jgi:hypothetical protein
MRALGLGRFVGCCLRTAIHTKRWWLLRQRLLAAAEPSALARLAAELARLARAEIANAAAAVPLVEEDSRLGWEPSMEYMADRPHLEWKIRQLQRVLDEELPAFLRRQATAR